METFKAKFWVRLTLVVVTSFIVISYIFKPSDNQCQMTFMMEPPKFIPIPVNKPPIVTHESHSSSRVDEQYKLFIYSEFGFPLESDMRRDLKDSMPVLFIPGNAGSYQQVRSLASTCIRRQLQSLDAFKFIFYTIDFRAQLSGISGRLVNDQILFLHSALNQIAHMHSIDTNGVIIVGHSVGGLIAKALLARQDLQTAPVPLLINLASPLTRSFLNFDDDMRKIYEETNSYWSAKSNQSNTLSISISGGKSDRLVPMHLSLDPHYDISLTTSSIKDVWLTTDHVCITWCRELMHKLAQLLSALMDKKHTKLIEDRQQALKLIADQLLTESNNIVEVDQTSVNKGQRLIDSKDIFAFTDYHSIKRNTLMEETQILNLTQITSQDLFIWIEHIDTLKDTGLYACKNIRLNQGQPFCDGRINLLPYAKPIPSRRFEPKKKIMMFKDVCQQFSFLVIDFALSSNNIRNLKIPELIVVQSLDTATIQLLHVPSPIEYLFRRFLMPSSLNYKIPVPNKKSLTYSRFQVKNLDSPDQFYSAVVETGSCETSDKPAETIVSLMQGQYLSESFHPDKNTLAVIVKLGPSKTIASKQLEELDEQHGTFLDIYIDGTCENHLRLEFDLWSFIENVIQNHPSQILTCSSYLAYTSVILQTFEFISVVSNIKKPKQGGRKLSWIIWLTGFVYSFAISMSSYQISASHINLFLTTFILSNGLLALIEYLISRLIDLAIIFNNIQTLIRDKIISDKKKPESDNSNGKSTNGNGLSEKSKLKTTRLKHLDGDLLLVFITISGSLILSEALMRLCTLFMVLKLELKLASNRSEVDKDGGDVNKHLNKTCCAHEKTPSRPHDIAHYMLLAIAALCSLSIVSNIPAMLLKISSISFDINNIVLDKNIFISMVSLVLVKLICAKVEFLVFSQSTNRPRQTSISSLIAHLPKHSHIIILMILAFINHNICHMNTVEMLALLWVERTLLKSIPLKRTKID